MKAFITGGTGFIGSHLVDELIKKSQNEISCLVRGDLKWLDGRPIRHIKGDLFDLKAIRDGMEGADVVFHCAGVLKAPDLQALQRGNVETTENILRMAIRLGIPKVIILSSQAAAGPSSGHPSIESDPMSPVSNYGQSKMMMEKMVEEVATTSNGTSITIIRPPAVYGPREQDILTIFKMTARGYCPIVGDGKSTRISMVHVRDLVHGIILAANIRQHDVRTFYISGEPPITWDEFRMASARALGRKVRAVRINPNWVQKIAAGVEKSASFFGIYPVLNKEKAREMVLEWVCSSERAREELGYKPKVSLDEGVFETIQWYKAHHWI
jgi:nucleoside-diphosphate-sugar epimerase